MSAGETKLEARTKAETEAKVEAELEVAGLPVAPVEAESANFVQAVHDPHANTYSQLLNLRGMAGKFFLCLGATETSDIPGISAAGVTAEARRLTPCLDAEALIHGRALSADSIPVSPIGIVSPIVITRACLELLDMEIEVVDCGTFVKPQVPLRTISGAQPARCASTGSAIDLEQVKSLFEQGHQIGINSAKSCDYLVIAECVPGGTTTALGVLTALGYKARNMLSSSLPECSHDSRFALIEKGLGQFAEPGTTLSELSDLSLTSQPSESSESAEQLALNAIACVGDPMQAFALGLLCGAAPLTPVILAGGSQMLAIAALYQTTSDCAAAPMSEAPSTITTTTSSSSSSSASASALSSSLGTTSSNSPNPWQQPIVITTKWVAFDRSAQTPELSRLIDVPYAASCPDFHKSAHMGLRAYEDGNVKEGTGAGAAMALAHMVGGFSEAEILQAIDSCYRSMVPVAAISSCSG